MRPGDVVAERFEVVQPAGSGGMGVVHRAKDRTTGKDVALKVLLDREQGPADRFAQEIELLAAIHHPHVVGYVSHGVTDEGAPYLVMPWLEGLDLQERLSAGPLAIDEAITIARHVADALACVHGQGLVHRDLKPSNLFLPGGQVEKVQLIDFGIARATASARALTLSGVLVGTPGFIAPEQARGDRDVAPAVDVFALGCVLFECLTGQRLFSGTHMMAVLAKILVEDAPRVRELRPEVPDALDLLVHRMVAKEPEKRPRDGADLGRWLANLERTPTIESRPQPSNALTAKERRVVSVLVVVLPPSRASVRPSVGDDTRIEADPLRSSASRFGVRLQVLADRTGIVLAPEGVSAADQAAVLARFALHVAETFPGARVALTTGNALTGSRLPVGEAIDRAVTMVRAVTPGAGVHVDDVTAALITSRFEVRREGEQSVVSDERVSLDPTRPLLGKPTSCVGREREIAILDATLAECEAGDGPKVVLVTAAAGAGKSRLRHELVRRLQDRAAKVDVHHCIGDPLHVSTPYAMIAQVVRRAAGVRERELTERMREKLHAYVSEQVAEADVARVSDFLAELIGGTFDDRGHLALRAARGDATAMAHQVRLAFEDLVIAWCKKRTVVLVLEDLHWADAASVAVIERALRKLEGSPLFVLALARPELHERYSGIFKNRDVTEIRLPPLPKRACARLVQEVMGDSAHAADVGRIVERSEGNAFYLEELIRAAAARARRLSTPPPGPSSSPRGDDLPETVIAVAQARLERLEPNVRKVLRAASIFGDVFWLEGVSALVGEAPATLAPIVRALIDHEAIVASERERFAGAHELGFRHALLRGAAYATLTEEDRALGHRLAASWLEGMHEEGEVVAVHWLEGLDRARAAEGFASAASVWWGRAHADAAARCAARSLLVVDGAAEKTESLASRVDLLARALEATRRLDARDVTAGIERYVPAFKADGVTTSHALLRAAFDRALEPLRARGAPDLHATLARAASALGALHDGTHAKALLAEATALVRDEAAMRTVRHASARASLWAGDPASAIEMLTDGVLPADPRERFDMLLMLATAIVTSEGKDALARALDFVSRAEAILDESSSAREDPLSRARVAKARVICFYFASEYAACATAAEEAVAVARRAGLRFDECAHLHNAAEQYIRTGDEPRARAALDLSESIARDIGSDHTHQHNEVLVAYMDASAERLARVADDARTANDPWRELHGRYWLGHLLAKSDGAPEGAARATLDRALVLAKQLKVRTMADECARALAALPA